MQIGMIGLGRMGANMARRLARHGHRCVVFDVRRDAAQALAKKPVVDHLEPIFAALAPGIGTIPRTPRGSGFDAQLERGYLHAGGNGAGHFVKMVHNSVEYGLMQAYAEGFDILRNAAGESLPAEHRLTLNVADIAEVWRRGSVVSSWLLDLIAAALAEDEGLAEYSGHVEKGQAGTGSVDKPGVEKQWAH
jgi:6-phosphogluconate dehydrogenase